MLVVKTNSGVVKVTRNRMVHKEVVERGLSPFFCDGEEMEKQKNNGL